MLNNLKHLIYRLGIGNYIDKMRFYYFKLRNRKKNKKFRDTHPNYHIPPDHFLYETFRLDYEIYFENINQISRELVSIVAPYIDFSRNDLQILDWGCGIGGNIKGLREILNSTTKLYGCDINKKMIEWCDKNIARIDFSIIPPSPPTQYSNESFDFIFGISIFTHLGKESHFLWIDELHRILRKGGILLFTTHGSNFKNKLTTTEKKIYNAGEIVERRYTNEGLRVFSSFDPPTFIQQLIDSKFEVLKFYDGSEFPNLIGAQDKWVLKKINQS